MQIRYKPSRKEYTVARGRGSTPLTDGDRQLLFILGELYDQLVEEIGDEFFGVTSRMFLSELNRLDWQSKHGMPRERRLRAGDRQKRKKQRSHITEWLRLMERRRLVVIEGQECKEFGWGLTKLGRSVTG